MPVRNGTGESPRITSELRKLGIKVAGPTVERYIATQRFFWERCRASYHEHRVRREQRQTTALQIAGPVEQRSQMLGNVSFADEQAPEHPNSAATDGGRIALNGGRESLAVSSTGKCASKGPV